MNVTTAMHKLVKSLVASHGTGPYYKGAHNDTWFIII